MTQDREGGSSPNLLGAELQILLGNADQEGGVQLLEVLGAQRQALHIGEVQLRRLLQECCDLLLSLVLLRCQKGLEENQHLQKTVAELASAWAESGSKTEGEPRGGRTARQGPGAVHSPGGTDLGPPQGLLHLLQELQLVLGLLQLIFQDVAPDSPWEQDGVEMSSQLGSRASGHQVNGFMSQAGRGPGQVN